MGTQYRFGRRLREGTVVRRNSQFTMQVLLGGEEVRAHCPATTRIGGIALGGVPCLVSESDDPKRKLRYTVEAISCDDPAEPDKNWVGINLVLSNRLVEFFLETHQMDRIISDYRDIRREVVIGKSKLDFLVGGTYLEAKTPLTTLNVRYGPHIRTKGTTPFSNVQRMERHVRELADSLQAHERAILLTVNQYVPTEARQRLRSTRYEEVREVMRYAVGRGVETWNAIMRFEPEGVSLVGLENTTEDIMEA